MLQQRLVVKICQKESSSQPGHESDMLTNEQHRTGQIKICTTVLQSTEAGQCDRIHSSLIVVHCFENGCVGKQPVAWKGSLAMAITEILLKMALNTKQSVNQPQRLTGVELLCHWLILDM